MDSEPDNPFEVKDNGKDDAGREPPAQVAESTPSRSYSATDLMEWRIIDGLLETLVALTQAYHTRGSPREAEYFAQQANELAKSMNAPATISRALALQAETLLHLGQVEESHSKIVQAHSFASNMSGLHAADIRRLRGEFQHRSARYEEAIQLYEEAVVLLDELARSFSSLDAVNVRWALSSTLVLAVLYLMQIQEIFRHLSSINRSGTSPTDNGRNTSTDGSRYYSTATQYAIGCFTQ